jgi:hypothetical protein
MVVLEGNDASDVLHNKNIECTTIFKEFSDWMSVTTQRNQELEYIFTKIQSLNEEVSKAQDPLE